MRRSHTAPMQVFSPLHDGAFSLEPYEAGWASEALAVVYLTEACGSAPRLDLRAEISVDGCRWINFQRAFEPMTAPGGYFLSLSGFGNWLRLTGEVSGGPGDGSPTFIADFYWVLKE